MKRQELSTKEIKIYSFRKINKGVQFTFSLSQIIFEHVRNLFTEK